jgi:hypothetical protein
MLFILGQTYGKSGKGVSLFYGLLSQSYDWGLCMMGHLKLYAFFFIFFLVFKSQFSIKNIRPRWGKM